MINHCGHCGFVFRFDDETTVEQAFSMERAHFEKQHDDLYSQDGILETSLDTGEIRYIVGAVIGM